MLNTNFNLQRKVRFPWALQLDIDVGKVLRNSGSAAGSLGNVSGALPILERIDSAHEIVRKQTSDDWKTPHRFTPFKQLALRAEETVRLDSHL